MFLAFAEMTLHHVMDLLIFLDFSLDDGFGAWFEVLDTVHANSSNLLIFLDIKRELLQFLIGQRIVSNVDFTNIWVDSHELGKEI